MNKLTKVAGVILLVAFTLAAADLAWRDGFFSPASMTIALVGLVAGGFTFFLVPIADGRARNREELATRISSLSRRGRCAFFAVLTAVAFSGIALGYWAQVWIR